ncbi:MAG: OmpA family protein, partial [Planktomarina sp.]|nr:OmpA family protein [Planktomarina sp.]
MAFFVLILSFADFNVPKFKQISGSLKDSFGVQKIVPVVEQPKGTTVIELNFSPNPTPSVTDNLRQNTNELQNPVLDLKEKDDDFPEGGENDKTKTADFDGAGGGGDADASLDADQLAKQLKKAIDTGEVSIETLGENVVINFPEQEKSQEDIASMVKETMAALSEARQASGQAESEVLFGGLEGQLQELAASLEEGQPEDGQGDGNSSEKVSEKVENASNTTEELTVALQQQIDQGLVEIEQREGSVFITVGSGGAFPSGTADLTPEAQSILDRIALTAMSPTSEITVTGHTDDVPIRNGKFRDNWDLAAGRAASVVQAIEETGLVSGNRLSAVSKGEMDPLTANVTAEGREENRRIEIEITY